MATAGGGLVNLSGGMATLTDCTISGNTTVYQGGGIENYYGSLTLNNCTVSGNQVTSANSSGGINPAGGTTTLIA